MAKWKLLAGMYIHGDPNWEASEEDKKDAEMRGTKPRCPSVVLHPGDTFESDLDMATRFGHQKFLLIKGTPNDPKKIVAKPGEEMRYPPAVEAEDGKEPVEPKKNPPDMSQMTSVPRPALAKTTQEELEAAEKDDDKDKAADQKKAVHRPTAHPVKKK